MEHWLKGGSFGDLLGEKFGFSKLNKCFPFIFNLFLRGLVGSFHLVFMFLLECNGGTSSFFSCHAFFLKILCLCLISSKLLFSFYLFCFLRSLREYFRDLGIYMFMDTTHHAKKLRGICMAMVNLKAACPGLASLLLPTMFS